MTEYLKTKWQHLRLYRTRRMFECNYRILKNTAKLIGARYERT